MVLQKVQYLGNESALQWESALVRCSDCDSALPWESAMDRQTVWSSDCHLVPQLDAMLVLMKAVRKAVYSGNESVHQWEKPMSDTDTWWQGFLHRFRQTQTTLRRQR
mmetsp:Transcript_55487/g.92249  ORF Transcript_55487/g.92249 Transcript_55487/m.92249 type:complete len:107 (+) Transcript_55487:1390-1710(+)